jgi:hypothetical protein
MGRNVQIKAIKGIFEKEKKELINEKKANFEVFI